MHQEQQHQTLQLLEQAIGKLGFIAQGSKISLKEALLKIEEATEPSETEAGGGKFSAIPSDFKLSYGR